MNQHDQNMAHTKPKQKISNLYLTCPEEVKTSQTLHNTKTIVVITGLTKQNNVTNFINIAGKKKNKLIEYFAVT